MNSPIRNIKMRSWIWKTYLLIRNFFSYILPYSIHNIKQVSLLFLLLLFKDILRIAGQIVFLSWLPQHLLSPHSYFLTVSCVIIIVNIRHLFCIVYQPFYFGSFEVSLLKSSILQHLENDFPPLPSLSQISSFFGSSLFLYYLKFNYPFHSPYSDANSTTVFYISLQQFDLLKYRWDYFVSFFSVSFQVTTSLLMLLQKILR